MWMHWLRQRVQRCFPRPTRRPRRPIRTRRLGMEALEDRMLPTGMGATLQIDGLGAAAPIAIQSAFLNQSPSAGQAGTQPQVISFTAATGLDSPLLVLHASDGMQFADAILSVPNGGESIQWTLNDVSITSFGTDSQTDNFTLRFDSVQSNALPSGNSSDATQGLAAFLQQPGGQTGAVPADQSTSPIGLLQLTGFSPISVQSAGWGVSRQANAAGVGTVQPQDFAFQLPETDEEPKLLQEVAECALIDDAYFTVESNGNQIQWALTNVTVSSANVGFNNPGGTDSITLHFDAIQESVTTADGQTLTAGWDFTKNEQTSISPPGSATKVSMTLVPTQQASMVLQLAGLDHSLVVQSFSWGERQAANASTPAAQDVNIVLPPTTEDPLLLLYAANGQQFQSAGLTVDLGGQQVTWALSKVSISAFNTSQGNGAGADSLSLHF